MKTVVKGFKLVRKQKYKLTKKQVNEISKKREVMRRKKLKKERKIERYKLKQKYKLKTYKLEKEDKIKLQRKLRRLYKFKRMNKISLVKTFHEDVKITWKVKGQEEKEPNLKKVEEKKKVLKEKKREEKKKKSNVKQYYKTREFYEEGEYVANSLEDGSEYSTSLETLRSYVSDKDDLEDIDENRGSLKDLQKFIRKKDNSYSREDGKLSESREDSLEYLTEEFEHFYNLYYDDVFDEMVFYTDEDVQKMYQESNINENEPNIWSNQKGKIQEQEDLEMQKLPKSEKDLRNKVIVEKVDKNRGLGREDIPFIKSKL